jgi:hypothetical protein
MGWQAMTLTELKNKCKCVPSKKRAMFLRWAFDVGYFEPKTPYVGLLSPQGHVEYNAAFVVGEDNAQKLEKGKWYTSQELANMFGEATFLKDSSQGIEKNVKKWKVV